LAWNDRFGIELEFVGFFISGGYEQAFDIACIEIGEFNAGSRFDEGFEFRFIFGSSTGIGADEATVHNGQWFEVGGFGL
jgi:hypothetical protein